MPLNEAESQKMWQKMLDALTPIFKEFTQASEKTMTQATETQPTFRPTFPDSLACLIQVEDGGSKWIVKPIKYLGAENFAAINDIVMQYKGEYKKFGSLGQKSPGQWWVPKK